MERQQVDSEWAVIRQQEREQAIKRAKDLLRADEPRVRSLHSQLLMSNVLQERDLQLGYKLKKVIAEKISEKEEVLKMRESHLKELEKEREKQEMAHLKRIQFASNIRQNIKERAKERDNSDNVYR